ncbi:MAG: hypothetical protein Q7R39_03355 [Dehalococcoidia bacterium]|nr:hypothetical protein [Dehalococcoidia bacterium]
MLGSVIVQYEYQYYHARYSPDERVLHGDGTKGTDHFLAEIRKTLKLKQGDKVGLSVGRTDQDKIQVTLRSVRSVAEMTFGSVTPRKRPEDFDELRQRFEGDVAEEAMRLY